MSEMIPLSVPHIKGNEWKYIKECLDTEWVSSVGKYVTRFEEDICAYTGSKYAIACVNGTAALHIALKILGVEEGDEVIVPTLTFIAPVNAVAYLGAAPVFMDADRYYNIDAEKTADFLAQETVFRDGATYNRTSGRRIAAAIPVHVFGNAADLRNLFPLFRDRNIRVVEDATESLGTSYIEAPFSGRHTGTIGDIGCLSFNGNKIITTGGGGMILTDDPNLAERTKYLTTQAKDDEVRFIHNEIGFNYRLTNLQAALGVAQLEQLPDHIAIKKRNYETYKKTLETIPGLHLAETPGYARNNHWMYALQVDRSVYGLGAPDLIDRLASNGVQARPVWRLNHLQRPYRDCQSYRIETAERLQDLTVNIPCSAGLTSKQIEKVVSCLKPC